MNINTDKKLEVPYLLLTPGPLTTTVDVREAMLKDWCTWDMDYNNLVQDLRKRLLDIGVKNTKDYTTVLMQGSGTFTVESVIGSSLGREDRLLIITNGAYGRRIAQIADILGIDYIIYETEETVVASVEDIKEILEEESSISHVAMVHCETTTGILNPIYEVGEVVKKAGRMFIVDAMSSFGGIDIDIEKLGADFLISSSNKCIQGVPGFAFVIAKKDAMEGCRGNAKSLSLDLYDQWKVMEENNGKWRYTSPTHVVRAFYQALAELESEGGVAAREKRYRENQSTLVEGMEDLGFKAVVDRENQSPIITSFFYPEGKVFDFKDFYDLLKERGFVIYPGKLTEADTFRIGNIGDIHKKDIIRLLEAVKEEV